MNGGCYTPPSCVPRQRVAILIPYKDRAAHLYSLLNYLHPMLQRQQIQYCVFIIEQVDDGRFNKGLVMNSGFKEIMKRDDFDCVVFHDVDMIPEDDRNVYLCQNMPTHLSPLIDKFNYEVSSFGSFLEAHKWMIQSFYRSQTAYFLIQKLLSFQNNKIVMSN